MKESIFFNKQQLQIIRWYNYLYTLFFEYWVWFFGFLISLLVVSGLVMFPIFSEVYGKETGDTTRIENQMRTSYMDQRSVINSFSWFHVQMLWGPVQSLTGGFSSQDNLINFSGLILPRTVLIDQAKWNTYAEPILNSTYDKNLINSYFLDIFVTPLQKTTLCCCPILWISSIITTVFPTPAPPKSQTLPPFIIGARRSMTLIQVSRIWALVLKDAKTGGFLWIGHWSTPETCSSPSIFCPKTLKMCPKTSFPTGTLIGDQVFSTESHLLCPSVESIAIPLTIPFSRIWSASMTTSLPFAFFERTLSAS